MKKIWRVLFLTGLVLSGLNLNAQTLRTATASATTSFGFVVNVTINDGGAGYTFPPAITISGVGSGAAAYSVISNGVVTQIVITSNGSGYTSVPNVIIAAPNSSSYSFHSGSAYVMVPDSASLDNATNQLTVECWFYRTADGYDWNSVVSKDENDNGFSGYDLRFNGNTLYASVQTTPQYDALTGYVAAGNIAPTSLAWHHYAMEYNGTNFSVWLDGGRIFNTNLIGKMVATGNQLTIGRQNASLRVFDGYVDEVRISKTIRYTNSFNPQIYFNPDTNTVALYHFSEGSGTTVYDSSGNGNNGIIYGSSAWSTNVPVIYPEIINLHKAVYVDFSNLKIGTLYQLQTTTNIYSSPWVNYGAPFTASSSSMSFSNYWNVSDWNQLYFRLSQ